MQETFVGIDVSKAVLDVAVVPTGEAWSVPNSAEGMRLLVKRLGEITPTLIVLEATGGLERRAVTSGRGGESATGEGFREGDRTAGEDRCD
jgi:transposase